MSHKNIHLKKLVIGDIFNAKSVNAPYILCLVTCIEDKIIYARRITDQENFEFDIDTGKEINSENNICEISSIAPLPMEIYNSLISLERKMRLTEHENKFKLDEFEKKALLYIQDFYDENRL